MNFARNTSIIAAWLVLVFAFGICSGCGQGAYDAKLESRVQELHANPPPKPEGVEDYDYSDYDRFPVDGVEGEEEPEEEGGFDNPGFDELEDSEADEDLDADGADPVDEDDPNETEENPFE